MISKQSSMEIVASEVNMEVQKLVNLYWCLRVVANLTNINFLFNFRGEFAASLQEREILFVVIFFSCLFNSLIQLMIVLCIISWVNEAYSLNSPFCILVIWALHLKCKFLTFLDLRIFTLSRIISGISMVAQSEFPTSLINGIFQLGLLIVQQHLVSHRLLCPCAVTGWFRHTLRVVLGND